MYQCKKTQKGHVSGSWGSDGLSSGHFEHKSGPMHNMLALLPPGFNPAQVPSVNDFSHCGFAASLGPG